MRCCSPLALPVLRPSPVLLPKLLKPSQPSMRNTLGDSLEAREHRAGNVLRAKARQDPWLDSCMLGVLPSPPQGRCLCPSPKYKHKTPVCARQSHPRSSNQPSRKARDNAQIQAVAGWNWASLIPATKTQCFGVANNKKVFSSKLYSSVC